MPSVIRSLLRSLFCRVRRDEQGSMIITIMAIGIVTVGLVTVTAVVSGGLELTRNDQNRTNAFQHANAGIDQALYRIDRHDLPVDITGAYVPTVTNGQVTSFTETVINGSSRFEVTASQTPPGQGTVWTVQSLGTDVSGRQRQAIATITATPVFVNGFFTIDDFYLTGNQDTPVAYHSSTCPTAATSCDLPYPIPGTLGTNATIQGATQTIRSFAQRWAGFNMYGRATWDAANTACASGDCTAQGGTVNNITNQLQITVPKKPSTAVSCPNGGNIGSANVTTTIQPGDYTCDNLNLQGTIVVGTSGNGTGQVRFWVNNTFSVAAGAVVNRYEPPAKFQVFYPAQSGTTSSSICGAEIWALLDTPGLAIDCTGDHQPAMYGAVVADLHGGTGNHFDFHWDVDSQYAVNDGKFVVKNWRECPVTTTNC